MLRIPLALFGLALVVSAAACGQRDATTTDTSDAGRAPASALDSQVTALVGETGAAGESRLQALGYAAVGGRTEDGASVTYWQTEGGGACVMVRTVDGRYAAIEPATAADCTAAAAATTTVAEADPGGYRTVCGVMVDGRPVQYVCSVVGGDQRTTPTTLRFPDMVMTLNWLDETRVRIEMEGMVAIEGTWAEAEGDTSIISPDQTWFYVSDRSKAASEVAAMGG